MLAPDGWSFPMAAPRSVITEFARRDGGIDDTSYFGPGSLSLRGAVMGDTEQELNERLDTLRSKCRPGVDIPIRYRRYPGDDLWEIRGKLGGQFETQRTNGLIAFYGVTFSIPSPLALSSAVNIRSYDPTLGHTGIGVEFDLDFDLDFPGTPPDAQMDFTVGGNYPTLPIFVITGPATDAEIRNILTDEKIVTTGSLLEGVELWIDVVRRDVRLGSRTGTLRLDFIDESQTDWFSIEPGPASIRMDGDDMVTNQTLLTVRWRDRRLPD